MTNKQQIQKLRDNAELAWAAYGYFHFANPDYKPDGWWNKDKKKLDDFIKNNKRIPTPSDILNIEYNSLFSGDFTPLQAQRFFSRYDLLVHQPNTESGFSATLFQNKETKEYTLAIRGTEPSDTGDLKTDARMALGYIPQGQYNDMLSFYNQCKAKYPAMTESKSLNIAGHSLGGALTQMLALSICDDNNEANINEVYTFNSPGAKNLKPHIALDSKQIYEVIKDSKNLIANERVA
ncbi:lipase family protein [Helicobacter bilis]|uniref:lipase family protein n=1 Tax=Helicobacter bilis TaxID=37372 RepID=UPI0004852126|nr:Mbeg1-like protein [Helicobacter bilis]